MSCFGQDPYFNCPNRSSPPLSVQAGTARCSLWGEMTKMRSCSSALVRTRRPVPAARLCPEAPTATAGAEYSQVSRERRGTAGACGGSRRAGGGGEARTGRPGKRRRDSPGLLGSRRWFAEGFARPAAGSVSTGSRRRRARRCPQRSGRTRRGAGLEGSGALPCLGPPLHGGPR